MTTPRRSLLALIAGLFAAPKLALAQTPPSATPAPLLAPIVPAPAGPPAPRVKMTTAKGDIVVEVYPDKAPLTAGLFLRLVKEKRYNKPGFYRVVKVGTPPGPTGGMIQGGETGDHTRGLPPIAHEPTTQTGLRHLDGALSMPRFAPGTARGEFFICIGDLTSLDAQPPQAGVDTAGFAAFGRVVEGMDVVKAVLEITPSPTAGPEGMKGQILATPLPITFAVL
jgi:peptidyl-prolyl cis-trans isomerase A (cyclophilin A)